jgi:hypothetical protein
MYYRPRALPVAYNPIIFYCYCAMSEPLRVVHLKRTRDGRVLVDCQVYIGRRCTMGGWNLPDSIWRNPYKLAKGEKDTFAAREKILTQYEAHVRARPHLMARLPELAHKTLGCFCAPKQCHGDVLVKLFREVTAAAAAATKKRAWSCPVCGDASETSGCIKCDTREPSRKKQRTATCPSCGDTACGRHM